MRKKNHPVATIIVIGLLLLVVVYIVGTQKSRTSVTQPQTATGGLAKDVPADRVAAEVPRNKRPSAAPAPSDPAVRIVSNQILATVNQRLIMLADLIPMRSGSNAAEQVMSRETYDYLLQRAIDRELLLQTAKAQGVELTSDQKQHLARVRAAREQREPGQIKAITLDKTQVDFEMRDAEAFLLQTTLLANMGASPNVSAEQVQNYYQAHVSEFGELPQDPQARKSVWADIDYRIRQQIASTIRAQFQTQLVSYMDRLKSSAQVVVNPVPVEAEQ